MDWFAPIVLEGAVPHDAVPSGVVVRLEPLVPATHGPRMFSHFESRVMDYLSRGGLPIEHLQDFVQHLEDLNATPNRINWAMVLGANVAGRISFSDIRPKDGWVEIGTMLMPAFWGGPANPSGKLLLMTHAFETLGANRVQFKVDARNERSQRAMQKLGAVREGVLRKYQRRADGFVRDSVIFSVLDDEWPRVKAALEERLKP